MKLILCVIAAATLAACATPQQREARINARISDAQTTCSAMGYASDHPQYQQCTMMVYQQGEANRQAANNQLIQSGLQMMNPPRPAPLQTPVTCRQWNTGWTCQ